MVRIVKLYVYLMCVKATQGFKCYVNNTVYIGDA